jgi:hypothetical protein
MGAALVVAVAHAVSAAEVQIGAACVVIGVVHIAQLPRESWDTLATLGAAESMTAASGAHQLDAVAVRASEASGALTAIVSALAESAAPIRAFLPGEVIA